MNTMDGIVLKELLAPLAVLFWFPSIDGNFVNERIKLSCVFTIDRLNDRTTCLLPSQSKITNRQKQFNKQRNFVVRVFRFIQHKYIFTSE